jgi:PhnB protein
MRIEPYLNFNGDCKEAFEFYAKVLKGKIEFMMTHAEAPPEAQAGPEWSDKILHARMSVGEAVLMASDVPADRYQPPRSFSVSLQIDDIAEAERVFKELSAGSQKIMMPIQPTFWAARFAMFFDKYNTPWMINCTPPTA